MMEQLKTMTKNDLLIKYDSLAEKRREEIRRSEDKLIIKKNTYYVSNDGSDENDGLSPERAWATLSKVSSARLCEGDGVLFRRGDLFRGFVKTVSGVTYGAYGKGEKPKLYGWDKNLADCELWEKVDSKNNIWRLKELLPDVGTLVFNEGEAHSVKLIPSYIGGRFVCRDNERQPFDMAEEMARDLDLYWHFDSILTDEPSKGESFPVPSVTSASLGNLYLRCDKGNPANLFYSIEALTKRSVFIVDTDHDVHIDNLCIKYTGLHAIAAGGEVPVRNLRVTNCEIGWIGGTILHYLGTDPNYPQGKRGEVTRFGNGVEIYGGCSGYEVSDCYFYQIYDAAITHQINTFGKKTALENIIYKNNLIEKCVYSIEYFLDMNDGDTESYMKNVEMYGNFLRLCGYGWGQQRHNKDTPAHIKGWSYENRATNFRIYKNIFDRSAYRLLHLVAKTKESCPDMTENTYIQECGKLLGQYGENKISEPEILSFDESAKTIIKEVFDDRLAKVYIF